MSVEYWWERDKKNRTILRETCSSATLSTRNPTWPTLGLKPGFRGEIPVTAWFKLLGSLWIKGEHRLVAQNVEGSLCTILGCCIIRSGVIKTTQKIIEFSAEGMNPVLFSIMSIARPISRPCHVNLKHKLLVPLSYYLCTKFKIVVTLKRFDYVKIERINDDNKTWHWR